MTMILVSCLLLLSSLILVDASVDVRYLFNNGQPMAGATCNENDTMLLNEVMKMLDYRKLRRAKVKTEARPFDFDKDVAQRHQERQLPYFPPYCKNNCIGYATGTCFAAKCKGYRRRDLYESNEDNEAERHLQTMNSCDGAKLFLNIVLDSFVSYKLLSAPCIALVNAPRSIECYEDVVYGEIKSFTAWKGNAQNTKLQDNVTDGYQVCRSQNVNFEAIGNECVYGVSFELIPATGGTTTSVDTTRPFSYMTNYGTHWFGMNLAPGKYTLKAYPNRFTSNTKQFSFTVLNC